MSAYLAYDRIEENKWVVQQLEEEKEKWIEDRAKELISMFPETPLQMSGIFLVRDAQFALMSGKAVEAYNDFISACAYARAEEEWQRQAPCNF